MSSSPLSQASEPKKEQKPSRGRPRIAFLSLANVISALAVITLHTNGIFWTFDSNPHGYWPSANIIEAVFYFAVPVFFMMSGATLLEYRDRYSTRNYFHKRITKTLIPFLFWSVVGSLYQFFVLHRVAYKGVVQYFDDLINARFVGIFWFFPALFILYLVIPLFSAVPTENKRKVFRYVVVCGLVLNVIIPFIIAISPFQISWNLKFPPAANYMLYALIGYLIVKSNPTTLQRIIVYVLGVAGLLAHILGTYYLSMQAGEIVKTYKGYENLPCLLYSVAIFIFLRQIAAYLPGKAIRFVDFLARYSFPVYLVHWFIIKIFTITFPIVDTTSLAYRLLAPFLIYAMIIPFTWLVRKIPGGRYILP